MEIEPCLQLGANPSQGLISIHPANMSCGRKPEYPEKATILLLSPANCEHFSSCCPVTIAEIQGVSCSHKFGVISQSRSAKM